jgi:hypothetical protein
MLNRLPDMLFGAVLAMTVFATGYLASEPVQLTEAQSFQNPESKIDERKPDETLMGWMTRRTLSDPVAFFTAAVAGFTFLLMISTVGLWVATNRNAKIAKDALTKLERPRILSRTPKFSLKDGNLFAQFDLINFGRDPGRIKEVWIKFAVGELPPTPDFSGVTPERPDSWILPMSTGGAVQHLTYKTREAANFFVAKIVYEWDFGRHEHALRTRSR